MSAIKLMNRMALLRIDKDKTMKIWSPEFSHSVRRAFHFAACENACVEVCAWDSEPRSGRGRLPRRKSQTPLQHRERAPCHNLCLKKHEFFSAQRQRWHFMFTTIISLVNDSCGCGAYESFREQTETLMLRALSSFAGCNFNGVSGSGTNSEVSMGIMISIFSTYL